MQEKTHHLLLMIKLKIWTNFWTLTLVIKFKEKIYNQNDWGICHVSAYDFLSSNSQPRILLHCVCWCTMSAQTLSHPFLLPHIPFLLACAFISQGHRQLYSKDGSLGRVGSVCHWWRRHLGVPGNLCPLTSTLKPLASNWLQ